MDEGLKKINFKYNLIQINEEMNLHLLSLVFKFLIYKRK